MAKTNLIDATALPARVPCAGDLFYDVETFDTVEVATVKDGRAFVAVLLDPDGDIILAARRTREDAAVRDLFRSLGGDWAKAVFVNRDVDALRAHYGEALSRFTDEDVEMMADLACANACDTAYERGFASMATDLMFDSNMTYQIDTYRPPS